MEGKLFYDMTNPILYDMKDEFYELLDFDDKDSNLDKWLKYKSYIVDEYSAFGIDCDVCEMAINVYSKAYKFLVKAKKMKQYTTFCFKDIEKPSGYYIYNKNSKLIPFGNIFNSINVSISGKNEAIDARFVFQREYKYQLVLNKEYYRGDIMTSFSNIYNHYKKSFSYNKDIEYEIDRLAKNHHTIGNMIPVPTGFNTDRAWNFTEFDYWDLAMMKIKEWYDSEKKNDAPLFQLLNNSPETVEYCKEWLKYFIEWSDFVKDNYLEDFTSINEQGDYIPIEFWGNHNYETPNLPNEKNEFIYFLKCLNSCIEKRGTSIINKLFNND